MKRHYKLFKSLFFVAAFVVILGAVYGITVMDYDGVFVGMSYEKVKEEIPEGFFYNFHCYYKNKWGNSVVVKMKVEADGISVEKIRCYSSLWTSLSSEAFNRIKYGMSPFDVTRVVGIPLGSKTSGYTSTYFMDLDGKECEVYWFVPREDPTTPYVCGLLVDGKTVFFGGET